MRNRGTGEVFVLTHAGSVAGSCEPGPRDDDWFDAGASQTIADGWAGFIAGGYSWAMRAGANLDTGSLVSAATTAVGATATVISLR